MVMNLNINWQNNVLASILKGQILIDKNGLFEGLATEPHSQNSAKEIFIFGLLSSSKLTIYKLNSSSHSSPVFFSALFDYDIILTESVIGDYYSISDISQNQFIGKVLISTEKIDTDEPQIKDKIETIKYHMDLKDTEFIKKYKVQLV